jgi:DNA-binding NarL/FixJ family response regulator
MAKPRVLLADDHTIVMEAFTSLLGPEFEIVGIVADGRALLKKAEQTRPDIVILDLSMPLLNGMDAGRELKKRLPQTGIIVVTMSEDFDLATEALRNWASAYLLKKSAASELVKAIREVLHGRTYVTPRVAQRMLQRFVRDPRVDKEKHLTPRQREVLQLLAEGRTMKEAAAVLSISERTVAFHKYQIMDEHGLKSQSDFVMFAIRQHVIVPPI